MTERRVNRRKLLIGTAAVAGGGLALSWLSEDADEISLAEIPGSLEPNAYLQITPDGHIILQVDKLEMGQGIMTGFVTLLAEELGVRIFICEMSMDLMGFKREEMIDYENLTFCGVAKFLEEAANSKVQLFI